MIKLIMIISLVAILALGGCTNGGCAKSQETTQPDIPTITNDEVIVIVKEYLRQEKLYTGLEWQVVNSGDWYAEYEGKGKWFVAGLTFYNLVETVNPLGMTMLVPEDHPRGYLVCFNYYQHSGIIDRLAFLRGSTGYNQILGIFEENFGPLPAEAWVK